MKKTILKKYLSTETESEDTPIPGPSQQLSEQLAKPPRPLRLNQVSVKVLDKVKK